MRRKIPNLSNATSQIFLIIYQYILWKFGHNILSPIPNSMRLQSIIIIVSALCLSACSAPRNAAAQTSTDQRIIPAAERIDVYLPLIKGKRVGIFANQTSMVGNTHLVDTLQKRGVDIKVIFGPEGSEPILGAMALEYAGFTVDPSSQTLKRLAARSLKSACRDFAAIAPAASGAP